MKIYICKYCNKSFSFDDWRKASGFMSSHQRFCESNPRRQQYLDLIRKTGLKGSHKNALRIKKQYYDSLKEYQFVCEHCGKEYSKVLSPKRYSKYLTQHHFCSRSCSNSRVHTAETKKKISRKLSKPKSKSRTKSRSTSCDLRETTCLECHTKLFVKTTNDVYCYGCLKKHPEYHPYMLYSEDGHRLVSEKTRNKQREIARKRVENGTHIGLRVRPIESYPEKFWKMVLDNNEISDEFNFPITKHSLGLSCSACYFLDFKLPGNVDLEIDGKQHKFRKEHDEFRDSILRQNGWEIYRIEWNEINSKNGKDLMKKKIEKFLQWYYSR